MGSRAERQVSPSCGRFASSTSASASIPVSSCSSIVPAPDLDASTDRPSASRPKCRRMNSDRRGSLSRTGRANSACDTLPKRSNSAALTANENAMPRPTTKSQPSATTATPMPPYNSDAPENRPGKRNTDAASIPWTTKLAKMAPGRSAPGSGVRRGSADMSRANTNTWNAALTPNDTPAAAMPSHRADEVHHEPHEDQARGQPDDDRNDTGLHGDLPARQPDQAARSNQRLGERSAGDDHQEEPGRERQQRHARRLDERGSDLLGQGAGDARVIGHRLGIDGAGQNAHQADAEDDGGNEEEEQTKRDRAAEDRSGRDTITLVDNERCIDDR